MLFVISVSVIQVGPDGECTLCYSECEGDDYEEVALMLLRQSTLYSFRFTSVPNTLCRHFGDI